MTAALDTLQSITWDDVRMATTSNETMSKLVSLIEDGLPESRQEMPPELIDYFSLRDGLYTLDGVILYNNRIVIPPSLRSDVLQSLHSAHQGISSMTSRAEASVFLPGITSAIHDMRTRCSQCNRMAPSQPNPPLPYQLYRSTHFNQFVLISFTMLAPITLSLWIVIATGLLWNGRPMVQRASYLALDVSLLLLVSVMSCHQMGAQSFLHQQPRLFSKTGGYNIAYHRWHILTAIVGQR